MKADWFEWREKKKRIELKIFSGDIHFPGEMDKIFRHSGILIPPGTVKKNSKESKKLKNWIYVPMDHTHQEKNLEFVNYIFYGNGKPIRGISGTSIQLVRTCLMLNWDQDKKNSSIEEAHASFVEVSANGLIQYFLRINLVKSHTSYGQFYYFFGLKFGMERDVSLEFEHEINDLQKNTLTNLLDTRWRCGL
ncbi:hypothetical protein Prudu_1320S000300 [Prunus dulcis]|uniref:Uncharacterized protein n=1 Tax=Prunus dulcis TaxID=3755 RepID=A0A5H2YFD1_PRUDU|nr:hypothetical protein Prudu_1320S000300 [Prunus dulcis]